MVVLPLPDRDASGPGKPLNGPGACRERADRGTINLAGPAQRDLVDDEDDSMRVAEGAEAVEEGGWGGDQSDDGGHGDSL